MSSLSHTQQPAAAELSPFPFCCPECRTSLLSAGYAYTCSACGRSYPLRDGIPSFTDLGYFYGTLPKHNVADLLRLAAENRMGELRKSLHQQKVKGRSVLLRSFQDSFADGRFVLPLDASSVVLDIGCGYGGLSIPLARACGRVVSVDATFERVKMVALRAEHEGLERLVPVHANALALPLPASSFDCVILNGVLEWVGEWDSSRPPREVQLAALSACRELLKPGGILYLAIENRWGLELLYRRKDHNKLYWTSFLPRAAADVATRVLKRKPYRTFTYGHDALLRLLADAGFARTQLYCPWSRYQDPDHVMRVGDEAAFAHFQRGALRDEHPVEAAAFGLLRRFGLHWRVAPAWIALARRP